MKNLDYRIEKWKGYEKSEDKIRKMINKDIEKMIKFMKKKKDYLNVIKKGECWVNKIMFK
jgi:hypothetical protein